METNTSKSSRAAFQSGIYSPLLKTMNDFIVSILSDEHRNGVEPRLSLDLILRERDSMFFDDDATTAQYS